MKTLFTVVAFSIKGLDNYLESAKKLAENIISNSPHDILITTNKKEYFKDIESSRVIVREHSDPDLKFIINSEFNYNSKYEAFINLPQGYDVIFYVDCDIKLTHWDDKTEEYLKDFFSKYDFGATRLNATFNYHYHSYKETKQDLFWHKFEGHELLNVDSNDVIFSAVFPSEHYLIFKYNKEALEKFAQEWKKLSFFLQNKDNPYGTLCDGFEIGLALARANITNVKEIHWVDHVVILGLQFNGNRL